MRSEMLKIATLHLKPILLVLSLIVLYRGHNEPGGGFIGGLLAGTAFVLHSIAFGVEETKKIRFVKPFFFIGFGLLCAILSGLIAVMFNPAAMALEGLWFSIPLLGGGALKLGTPLLFDIGVYFVVAGMLILVTFTVEEE